MGAKFSLCFTLAVFLITGCIEVTDRMPLSVVAQEGDSKEPIEGAQFCETDTANCALTNAMGLATIELPPNETVSFTLVKEEYGSAITPVFTHAELWGGFSRQLWTDEWYTENFDKLLTAYPMTDAGAVMVELHSPFAGATFRLVDATGKRYYFDEEGNLSLALEATTSVGMGGFVEVQPGTFRIEIGGRARDCTSLAAWPSDEDDTIRVPVLGGYMTTALITCLVD